MKVICRKIISDTTGEDLGEKSPWLKIGQEYVVLSLYIDGTGIEMLMQCEHYHEPAYFSTAGFEFIDQKIPSSWDTITKEPSDMRPLGLYLGPASWYCDEFYEELDDGKLEAYELFVAEAKKIYDELGEKMPPYKYSGPAISVSFSDSYEEMMRAFGYDPNDEKQVEAWCLLMESDDEKKP